MSTTDQPTNSVRIFRLARQWSQAELADRAGISRAAVSAIESERLVPSVAAAMALAFAFDCAVEDLFGKSGRSAHQGLEAQWAWQRTNSQARYWCAAVGGAFRLYPVEPTPLGTVPHDGVGNPQLTRSLRQNAERTLVLATCDPAVGLLARTYEQMSGYRMLVVPRSSRRSLELLEAGLIHVAGIHFTGGDEHSGNSAYVARTISQPARLLRVASWDEGVAIGSGLRAQTVRGLFQKKVVWVGREPGSGARQCLDSLFENRPAPEKIAGDHRGVAEAIRFGWADAGVCLKLTAEEAGLGFISVRSEEYDLCITRNDEYDPRIRALIGVVKSRDFQRLLGELPGYDVRRAGDQAVLQS